MAIDFADGEEDFARAGVEPPWEDLNFVSQLLSSEETH